jgi:hypothetical protein
MKTTRQRFTTFGGFILLLSLAALTQSGAQTCVQAPTGLVSWWPGDGDALDIVGGNNGMLQNGATFAAGMVWQAFVFDGIDDKVVINSAFPFHNPGGATLDFWLKFTPLAHQVGLLDETR